MLHSRYRRQVLSVVLVSAALLGGCSREEALVSTGSDVTLEKKDGVTVSGRLVEVQPQEIVLETPSGQRTRVPRSEIRALRAATTSANTPAPQAPAPPSAPAAPLPDSSSGNGSAAADAARAERSAAPANARAAATDAASPRLPEYREVTVPSGTVLPIDLRTTVSSENSRVEDQVRGTLRRSIIVDGIEAIPAGATLFGAVTEAERSARVKGRARVAFRFNALELPNDSERIGIRTATIAREAQGTKKQDAAKIGGAAAAGAVIGGIIGGGDGAAKGAAIGGGAGTGVVLSTRGKEIVLPAGTDLSARLSEPLRIRVRMR